MPGWSNDGKPDWAKDQETEANRSSDSSSWQTEPSPTPSTTNTNSKMADNNVNSYEADKPPRKAGCCAMVGAIVSVAFLGLFITGAIKFDNDKSVYDQQWLGFYCFQATVAAMSILCRVGCQGKCESFANSLATGGLIWSIVLIIMSSINYNDSNGSISLDEFQSDVTGMDDQNALELATSLVGFVNCVYHMMLYCCCS